MHRSAPTRSRGAFASAATACLLVLALNATATSGCREESEPPTSTTASTSSGGGAPDGGQGGDGPSDGMTLVSWNLETFPLSSETPTRVGEILDDLRPDIVSIQDISDAAAFTSFAAGLADYEGLLNDDPGAFLRVGLLYRPSTVTISDVETLFRADWQAFPRPPLKVRAEVTPSQGAAFDFLLVVVHLKAQLDEESRQRREAACEALDDWIRAQLAAGPEQDVIVAGDWNDELTDEPLWNVFDRFLDAPDDYTFLTLPLEQAGEHTYLPFDSFIDHILITHDVLAEYGDGTTEVPLVESTYPSYETHVSDHRPVVARFSLPSR